MKSEIKKNVKTKVSEKKETKTINNKKRTMPLNVVTKKNKLEN